MSAAWPLPAPRVHSAAPDSRSWILGAPRSIVSGGLCTGLSHSCLAVCAGELWRHGFQPGEILGPGTLGRANPPWGPGTLHGLSRSEEKAFCEGSEPGSHCRPQLCFPPSEVCHKGGCPGPGPPQGSDGAQAAVLRPEGKVLSLPRAPHPPRAWTPCGAHQPVNSGHADLMRPLPMCLARPAGCAPHINTHTGVLVVTNLRRRDPSQPKVSHTHVSLGASLTQMGAFYGSRGCPSQEPTSAGPETRLPPTRAPGSRVQLRPRGQRRALFTLNQMHKGWQHHGQQFPGPVPQGASGCLIAPHHHREVLGSHTCKPHTAHSPITDPRQHLLPSHKRRYFKCY